MKRQQQQQAHERSAARDAATRSGVEASVEELAALRPLAADLDCFRPGRVTAPLSGGHRSPLRGRGMEFAEVRAYAPGDEVRHMDWRVTARTGKPHSKLFEEERERPVIVVADMRSSMRFGTRQCFKSVAAARWAALVAWAALERGDRVGGVTLSGSGVRSYRVRRDCAGTAGLIAGLADATVSENDGEPAATVSENDGEPAALCDALAKARKLSSHGTEVFVLSDFADLDEVATGELRALARHTHTCCVLVHDPLESAAPSAGLYRVSNGQRVVALGIGSQRSRDAWVRSFEERLAVLRRFCHDTGAHLQPLSTASSSLGFGATHGRLAVAGESEPVHGRGRSRPGSANGGLAS